MLANGISIKGSCHDKNQDCYAVRNAGDACVIAVSDGLGECKSSELGSAALCQSACDVVTRYRDEIDHMRPLEFAREVHGEWLRRLRLAEVRVDDCCATMLILLILPEKIIAVRLGDGFVSFWADDEVRVLFDPKVEYDFEIYTDCLNEVLTEEKVECVETGYKRFHGGVLCTDGFDINNTEENIRNFTLGFINEYGGCAEEDALKEIEKWTRDWGGADDKTLAFALEGKDDVR